MENILKHIYVLLLVSFSFNYGIAQSLEGKWVGRNFMPGKESLMSLNITRINDTTYNMYTYTFSNEDNSLIPSNEDTTTAEKCLVNYKLVGQDSIYLEEVKLLNKPTSNKGICFQKFDFKIIHKEKVSVLNGTWKSEGKKCESHGLITFIRENHI